MARYGFIHDKLDIKFLILYLMARVVAPIDFPTLTDLTMCDGGVDYFEFAEAVNELVETGRYQNRSEVIRAGLRLLLQQEAQNSAKLEALRNATSSGLMQLERGEYDEITSDDLTQYLDELGNQASH